MARGDILELAVWAGCLLTIGVGMWALFIMVDWFAIDDALDEGVAAPSKIARRGSGHEAPSAADSGTSLTHSEGGF